MVRLALVALVAVVLTCACGGLAPSFAPPGGSAPAGSPAPPDATTGVPMCADVPQISAPADWYDDTPIYVGNEMPVDQVRGWAAGRPGYQEIWIDREHLGWITVAFSEDAEARQAELEREFPDVGVVAVEVRHTAAELDALQRRVTEELAAGGPLTTSPMVNHGVVMIGLGVLDPQRVAAVEARFGDEPVCIDGVDPATLPSAGPQRLAGDGWRLVADERTGQPYRTGIAFDRASLERLWRDARLSAEIPAFDFTSEVVIWFGAVYSGSCPEIRLDDVVVDPDRAIVHAEIVDLDAAGACTADANPRAYVVALERSRLPPPPFRIQLGAEDGLVEERTVVEADLRPPGSTAETGAVHGDDAMVQEPPAESGAVVETDFPFEYRFSVHCGIEWLGELNSVAWRTDVPADVVDFVPPQWEPVVVDQTITVSAVMRAGDVPTITATANGHDVVYRATSEVPPGCD